MSGEDRFLELAPLAALEALDPAEAQEFAEHARGCPDCRCELEAFVAVGGTIGAGTPEQPPPARLRQRVLGAVGVTGAAGAPSSGARWPLTLAASLAAALGAGLIAAQRQCAENRRWAQEMEGTYDRERAHGQETERRRAELERELARQAAVHELLADAASREVTLAALPPAPGASARVVWNLQRRRAVLLASGLQPAPPGKRYEVWVIAGGAPVPSGLFQADARGSAVAELPWQEQTAAVRTFAVTLEPEAGTPAPTGPMVLAGNVAG